MELRSSLHYSPVRGISLSWRTIYSNNWGAYQPSPQELPSYQGLLYTRGLPQTNNSSRLMISTLCLTSNLPFITSQSLIGKDVKLQAFLSAGGEPGTGETGVQEELFTKLSPGRAGKIPQEF